jgi:prepilin-type processing-associated H-X9-DG protein
MFRRIVQALIHVFAGGPPVHEEEPNGGKWQWRERFVGAVLSGLLIMSFLPVLEIVGLLVDGHKRKGTDFLMRQWGFAFKLYANESGDEQWPSLAAGPGPWVPVLGGVPHEYLNEPAFFVSLGHRDHSELEDAVRKALEAPEPDFETAAKLMGESFAYLGYLVASESDMDTLQNERQAGRLGRDDATATMESGWPLVSLRVGVGRYLFSPMDCLAGSGHGQDRVPVLVEIAGWRHPEARARYLDQGAHVLYMDGHVELVPYGTFPVLPQVMDILSGLTP